MVNGGRGTLFRARCFLAGSPQLDLMILELPAPSCKFPLDVVQVSPKVWAMMKDKSCPLLVSKSGSFLNLPARLSPLRVSALVHF